MNWVVGDIHGMLRPLTTLLAAIDDLDPDHQLYFCGDYCDRGPDTRGVVDALIPLVESGRAVCVRGNHDDVFDLCLNRHSLASGEATGGSATEQDVKEAVRLFWREGLLETMRSYGVDLSQVGRMIGDRGGIDAWVQEQFARVPESHRRFFRTLPAVAETDGFFVAHATWPPELADGPLGGMNALLAKDALLRHDTIWGRYVASQLRSRKAWSRRGYFGHTPTRHLRRPRRPVRRGGGRDRGGHDRPARHRRLRPRRAAERRLPRDRRARAGRPRRDAVRLRVTRGRSRSPAEAAT